jgi:hypothetical protein
LEAEREQPVELSSWLRREVVVTRESLAKTLYSAAFSPLTTLALATTTTKDVDDLNEGRMQLVN